MAGYRVAASTATAAGAPQRLAQRAASVPTRDAGPSAAQFAALAGRVATHGVGGFLRPFRRVGGILWLEVTGVLFLLPALVFAPALWRATIGYSHSSDHRTFWTAALVVAVFLYLSISSFWRAHRRSVQDPG